VVGTYNAVTRTMTLAPAGGDPDAALPLSTLLNALPGVALNVTPSYSSIRLLLELSAQMPGPPGGPCGMPVLAPFVYVVSHFAFSPPRPGGVSGAAAAGALVSGADDGTAAVGVQAAVAAGFAAVMVVHARGDAAAVTL
jgi:hypothetical protein